MQKISLCFVKRILMIFICGGISSPLYCAFAQGVNFYKQGQNKKAIEYFKKELRNVRPNPNVYNFLAFLLSQEASTISDALAFAEILEEHDAKLSFKRQAAIHRKMGHCQVAHELLEKAFTFDSQDPGVRVELFKSCLQLGDFVQAAQFSQINQYRDIHRECLRGKRVLVRLSQGMGDQLMYLRFSRYLKERGAKVCIMAKKEFWPLIKLTGFVDELILPENVVSTIYDYVIDCCIGTLMVASQEMPIEANPYLKSSKELANIWCAKLKSDSNFKIGLFWQGSCAVDNTGQRKPGPRGVLLNELGVLTATKGVSFYSLQQVNPFNSLEEIQRANIKLFEKTLDLGYGSFMETAAVIDQMDLVISADSSIAHLAGGMGKPVWVMLPLESDYRWQLGSEKTFWYPSMKLYRSGQINSFADVISRMQRDLEALVRH